MDWEAFYNNFRSAGFIPGYEIQNRLGGGAFGDVYKARKQSIGKAYAIKFLKIEDDAQREAVERELSQVRHFAAIDHPNLVTIEDMGTAMGVPYLIMGYAGEETLSRRLRAGPMERDEALLYFTQACRGVLALHDRRLVHFDLKPSNIFIKGEVARVGDYGLSKLLTDGRMTLSFGRGTPQYMAPEILRSRADHRADIYSLGVILFEALTGKLPFEPSAEGGLVLREEDLPPEFPADFPARLRGPVETCLRLAADHRFADVGDLLEAIGQTARQGDSVTMAWDGQAGSSAPAPEETSSAAEPTTPAVGESGSTTKGSELLRTAADLARGAVEVARGVWDGLRATSGGKRSEPEESAPEPRAAGEPAEGIALLEETPPQTSAPTPTPAPETEDRVDADSPTSAQARAMALVSRLKLGTRTGSAATPDGTRPSASPGQIPQTVPVPPRVEGGFLGTVIQTIVVAGEILIALVGNLVRWLASLFRVVVDRLLVRSGGFFGRVLGLIGFLLFMAALGFGIMLVGMVFLDAAGMKT